MDPTTSLGVDYKALAFYLDVAQWLSILGLALWGYLRGADNDNAKAIQAVADELAAFIAQSDKANNEQNLAVAQLQERVRHMPSDDELTRLEGAVREVNARVEGMEDLLKRVEHQVLLINQHLLGGGR